MSEPQHTAVPLPPEESARLIEFARAFKAAARAVSLYPAAHPAIAVTLGRIVNLTSNARLPAPLRITVLPDGLLLDDRPVAKPDPAIAELADLLHSHVIGAITVRAGGDLEAWRNFLLLIARAPDALRAEGGITRVWATSAGQHLDLREIDYAEVLRERKRGKSAAWERVIANCLQGGIVDLDDEVIRELLEAAGDSEQLAELVTELEARVGASAEGAIDAPAVAVLHLLRTIFEAVSHSQPQGLDGALRNMAGAVGPLAPDTLIDLLAKRGGPEDEAGLMNVLVSRMSDATIAQFVARNVIDSPTSTNRLAVAFQALVKEKEDRTRLLALAHKDVGESPLGNTDGFEEVWNHVAEKLLTSYSDKPFVSEEYGRELSGAGVRAIDVEQTSDDPPERIAAWVSTVAVTVLRALDLALVLDVLRIEPDDVLWAEMMEPVVAAIDDSLLVGDFEAAAQLVEVLTREAAGGESPIRRQHAIAGIDNLVAGPMMRHIVTHLTTIDEVQFECIKAMCLSLGEVVVKPLAEALAGEERARPRQRLTAILLGFGVVGKRTAERLKGSPNPAVRRTAIYLLREFGGSDALPDLTELLDDNEPQVQREAVRAILNIGTEQSYQVLEKALASGTDQSREAIMKAVIGLHDDRATPLFIYIVRQVSHRGPLVEVYLRAIKSLGATRDPEAVAPLQEALYRGEWWAPRRTAVLRLAAAEALARLGSTQADAVLSEAASNGPRGVRAVARVQLGVTRAGNASSRRTIVISPRAQLADELLRRLAAALRSRQLYSPGHPIITRTLEELSTALQLLHGLAPTVVIGLIGEEVVVDDTPIAKADVIGPLIRRLQRSGVERIAFDRGVTRDEITQFLDAVAALEPRDGSSDEPLRMPDLPHIHVGRVTIEQRVDGSVADMAAIKRLYNEAVSSATSVWESASTEGKPDMTIAGSMVDGLAQAVAQNRTALLALTTLKNYDNYTFTHMVNVSILTMGQARALNIDGPLLREFGLAGLMHDIGKVRTPLEILNKPDKLTDGEFAIMKRHPVEGAEILRRTPDTPALVPVMAFEHHLRLDGSGYPHGVKRPNLNVGTMLCSIADVYDAMRSQRKYQQSFPTDRILEVLKRNDGVQFDQNLVRRFTQLIGIYPVGNLVRLTTGDVAVVLKVNAADPLRPQVRVLFDSKGNRLALTRDLNLWESNDPDRAVSIVAPLDPAAYQIDPLTLI